MFQYDILIVKRKFSDMHGSETKHVIFTNPFKQTACLIRTNGKNIKQPHIIASRGKFTHSPFVKTAFIYFFLLH